MSLAAEQIVTSADQQIPKDQQAEYLRELVKVQQELALHHGDVDTLYLVVSQLG